MNDDIITAYVGIFLLGEGQRNHWGKIVHTHTFINTQVPILLRRHLWYEENCFKNVQPAVWQFNIL